MSFKTCAVYKMVQANIVDNHQKKDSYQLNFKK